MKQNVASGTFAKAKQGFSGVPLRGRPAHHFWLYTGILFCWFLRHFTRSFHADHPSLLFSPDRTVLGFFGGLAVIARFGG
jgi:hypothetical protein